MTQLTHSKIGESFQIEENMCHIDTKQLERDTGFVITTPLVTRAEGIDLFNKVAEANGLPARQDPAGYMILDDNVYQYLHESYEDHYERAAEDIEGGFGYGTVHAMNGVLDKLKTHVRNNVREHLPEGVQYSELRFKRATPELKDAVDTFVEKRVNVTRLASMGTIGRKVEQATFDRATRLYHEAGFALGDKLANRGGGELVR